MKNAPLPPPPPPQKLQQQQEQEQAVAAAVGATTDPHLVGAPKLHREAPDPAELITPLRLVEVAVAAVAVAAVAVVVAAPQEEIGTARVGGAETQTRTFRHHAGKLIAVILTTVKAGVTDPMDSSSSSNTIARARRRGVVMEGIFTRGTIAVRDTPGHRIGNGGVTVDGSYRGPGPGRGPGGLAREIESAVPSAAGLTLLLHTRDNPPQAPDRVRRARMNLRGRGQGPRGKTPKTATARFLRTVVAEDQQGSAMNVYRTGHMLIRGRKPTEVTLVMRHAIVVAAL